ncbi:MAG: ribosomal subunit interface protein, partial [Candidatus Aminicenantes bacterium]|nr:ribosomal subunit interface protein [Gammaproteobacteria bacterium]NIO85881.1 ribosomal subunit interface protein [Candidatus Aminicenantes bacterium]NIT27806.1 ribosomal subunit interface protein [Candidatus Aminicenantes bacterium]
TVIMNYDKEYIASLIKPGQVHRSIYTDPLLFDLEMEKIFKVAWNYVGHESQVPAQGDFIT